MALASLAGAELLLGGKSIFEDLNLQIHSGDRIGLIGPNGSGKSSLLKVFDGLLELDRGERVVTRGVTVGRLAQDFEEDTGQTPMEVMFRAIPGRDDVQAEVTSLEALLTTVTDEDEQIAAAGRLGELHEALAHFDSFFGEHVARRILTGLGFVQETMDAPMTELSGGWRMRVILGSLLFRRPDVLLLDEPTNHLDLSSVAWFGRFLATYHGAFVLISHDGEFLNEQVKRIVSFEPEGVRNYAGNLKEYYRKREEERENLENRARNLAREREKAEQFINRFRAQANKAKAVQSRVKALEKMDEVARLDQHQSVTFRFAPTKPCSKLVLRTEDLGHAYGPNRVFKGVDLSVHKGDKIGVIGLNGAGKTTLLKILAAELAATDGNVELGHHVERGYFAQHHADKLDTEATIIDEVGRAVENIETTKLRNLLGSLLFTRDEVDKEVSVLSGGERARVALAKMLLNPSNLLLMDEPTNHLDLSASEHLADALAAFDGTLIFVSHNRGFVRRLATRIWNVREETVEDYPGTLDDYMASELRRLQVEDGDVATPLEVSRSDRPTEKRVSAKERRRREAAERQRQKEIVGPCERRVAEIEEKVSSLERIQGERSAQLADPEFYADTTRSTEVSKAFTQTQAELVSLNEAWEAAMLELENAKERAAEE